MARFMLETRINCIKRLSLEEWDSVLAYARFVAMLVLRNRIRLLRRRVLKEI